MNSRLTTDLNTGKTSEAALPNSVTEQEPFRCHFDQGRWLAPRPRALPATDPNGLISLSFLRSEQGWQSGSALE
jgi:hypothetical protein